MEANAGDGRSPSEIRPSHPTYLVMDTVEQKPITMFGRQFRTLDHAIATVVVEALNSAENERKRVER